MCERLILQISVFESFTMNQKVLIALLVIGITIKSAAQGIIVPIILEYFTSVNFIMTFTTIQFILIFGILYYFLSKCSCIIPEYKLSIVLSGVFTGLMAVTMSYAARPDRTPITIQTILAGLPIIPSMIMRKIILNKIIIYDMRFIAPSIICFIASVVVASIPFAYQFAVSNLLWILVYTIGIIFQSAYNVYQEKYMTESDDSSLLNKVMLVYYSRIIELLTIISFCWCEYLINGENIANVYGENVKIFFTDHIPMLLFEGFIIAYIFAYIMSVYLNNISTNYNMMIPAMANPIVCIFFTVFTQFNIGIKYPIWAIVVPIICSSTGIILWMFGEKNKSNYDLITNEIN